MSQEQEQEKADSPIPTARDGVSREAFEALHEANKKFSDARHHVDAATDEEQYDSLEDRERAMAEVRDAEQKAEKADEKVKRELDEKKDRK